MVSRDEQQPEAASQGQDAGSARAAEETTAPLKGREKKARRAGSGTGGDAESAARVVTTVNPRIVPAGSRSPAPPAPPRRPRRVLLAAIAALAVVGLLAGGFTLYGGGDDTRERTASGGTPGPEWQGGQEHDAVSPPPGDSSSGDGKGQGKESGQGPERGSNAGSSGDGDAGKDRPPQSGSQAPPAPGPPPGGSGGGNGSDGTVRIWNHNSDQCIAVPGGEGSDGTPLQIRTCSGAGSQQWEFASDGTVRALGLCMDVADASSANGTVIQLAVCSGNPAQQFRLSDGSDLVNPQADKCVAVRDGNVQSGTPLQLWDCSGDDSQKWSPA
ncbi:MAG TPA: ricin-type beta-trefoil lectin domain protein [Streptomyces sp.]|nr:ricin-type beta-trefoil lectin domain protein [Streptomyces sp.]